MVKYIGPIVAVEEIAPSRYFYEHLLGQKVKYDFGVNVTFEGDFAIHLRSHLQALQGETTQGTANRKSPNAELCFETDEIEALCQRLKDGAVEFVHEIREQPWAQRVMRLYDPDGHILEIGETMDAVVRRTRDEGKSIDEIITKTGMPRAFVEGAVQDRSQNRRS